MGPGVNVRHLWDELTQCRLGATIIVATVWVSAAAVEAPHCWRAKDLHRPNLRIASTRCSQWLVGIGARPHSGRIGRTRQTRMRAPMGWVIGDAPDSEGTGLLRGSCLASGLVATALQSVQKRVFREPSRPSPSWRGELQSKLFPGMLRNAKNGFWCCYSCIPYTVRLRVRMSH